METERQPDTWTRRAQFFLQPAANGGQAGKWRAIAAGVFVSLVFAFLVSAPSDFPENRLVHVEEGMTLDRIAQTFKESDIIRSEILFKTFVRIFAGDTGALAGDYFFENKQSVAGVARRVSRAIYGLSPVRITIPEGATVADMATLYAETFQDINREDFLAAAAAKEGFLFPDTYLFLPNVTVEQVIAEMEENFAKKIKILEKEEGGFQRPVRDIVIMASLLEKEARRIETKRIISGILWKRIEIGMPLQVDAVFPYIIGKNTFEVTLDDLNVDSPYNTYKYRGLPVGPIANPGMDSLRAAVTPIETEYLFYLSDRSGNMYYSPDFEGHVRNKNRYLK